MENRRQVSYVVEQTPCFNRTCGIFSAVWAEKGLVCTQHSDGFRMAGFSAAKMFLTACHRHLKISTFAKSCFIIAMKTSRQTQTSHYKAGAVL